MQIKTKVWEKRGIKFLLATDVDLYFFFKMANDIRKLLNFII